MNIGRNYKWLMASILFLGLLGLNVLWFIPSPLLTVIMADLDMDLSQGGLGMSIVGLFVAIFSLVGGILIDRIGVKRSFMFGLWFMAVGATATYLVDSYAALFISRVLIGIGFGLCIPVSGVLIMMWFNEKERPYLNTIDATLPYIATFITFSLTIPLYKLLQNSWRMSIAVWGLFLILIALSWTIWGRENNRKDTKQNEDLPEKNLLASVWKNREVKLLSFAEVCDLWSFQFLSSMLPTYFVLEAGLDMASASNLTAIFPIAGIIAGLLCGFWMSKVGLRRPFTWPNHLLIFVGTVMAVYGTDWIRIVGVFLAGFGNAGWAPALFTMPMEFENMNPAKVGAVYGIMMSMGFMAAFISPWLGGWLAEQISLQNTLFIFSFSSLIAAILTFAMKETGPSAK